jgi:hypothetical protein
VIFEVHVALLLEIQVFWDVTLCNWLSSLGLLNTEDESTTPLGNTLKDPTRHIVTTQNILIFNLHG